MSNDEDVDVYNKVQDEEMMSQSVSKRRGIGIGGRYQTEGLTDVSDKRCK